MTDLRSRALGAMYGLAIGDALGMPTQSLPRELIVERYGEVVEGFLAAPDDQPIAAGLPAGSVTDDTEQAVLLAELVVQGRGTVDPAELGRRLLRWEDRMRARGSLDLLGPSTRTAIDQLTSGMALDQTGRSGTTNGAAMRITPVGVATPSGDLTALVDRVVAASSLSHNTGSALAGASAVAAAVSAAVAGSSAADVIGAAIAAAQLGQRRGHWVAGADVAARIRWAVGLVAGRGVAEVLDVVYRLVGTSLASQESVPAAFAVFSAFGADPWSACRIAASLGGDTDTVAAMVGAMSGAGRGLDGFPRHAVEQVERVNHLDLGPIVSALLAVRAS